MYDRNDRSRARSRRLRPSAFASERVNARAVRHRLGAQDSEMAAGHQVDLGAGDEAGELATVGDERQSPHPAPSGRGTTRWRSARPSRSRRCRRRRRRRRPSPRACPPPSSHSCTARRACRLSRHRDCRRRAPGGGGRARRSAAGYSRGRDPRRANLRHRPESARLGLDPIPDEQRGTRPRHAPPDIALAWAASALLVPHGHDR